MHHWKVRKRYRLVAQRLRKRATDAVQKAEADLIATFALGDRLEAELSVIRYAERMLHARFRRACELLEGLTAKPLDVPAAMVSAFSDHSSDELRHAVAQFVQEFAQLERRAIDLRERLVGVGNVASAHFEYFLRCAQSGARLEPEESVAADP